MEGIIMSKISKFLLHLVYSVGQLIQVLFSYMKNYWKKFCIKFILPFRIIYSSSVSQNNA